MAKDMSVVKFRHLIDMAIGSPEPGHVNFYALHCLLSCIAEKVNIIDETIDYSKYEAMPLSNPLTKGSQDDLNKIFRRVPRICAGEDTENNKKVNETDVQVEEISEPKIDIDDVGVEKPTQSMSDPQLSIQEPKPQVSPSVSITTPTLSPKISLHNLNDRIFKLEEAFLRLGANENLFDAVRIMKDQLEMSMDQLLLLTVLTLSKKPETQRVQELYTLAKTLRSMRKANLFIEGSNRFDLHGRESIDWRSSELQLNENVSEEDILENRNLDKKDSGDMGSSAPKKRLELEACLCYSPEKILDQLMELKGDFCLLSNKVNELSARLLKQESQQTLALIQELQEQMKELKQSASNLKDMQDRLQVRVTTNFQSIEGIQKTVGELTVQKVNKSELEVLLADKVDYNQLQRKVSLDQMLDVQCRIDKRFSEVFRQIRDNDEKVSDTIEGLKKTLGFAAIDAVLHTFKEQISKDIHALYHLLQKYIDSTNDDCAAASGRVKVMQDLACLSCNTTCVMRTVEKSKVGKLPNARAGETLSPLITYELGSIRKSGIMGYYRKDEFPHAPHAYMKRQEQQMHSRQAGGSHTTSTARERVDKVLLQKP